MASLDSISQALDQLNTTLDTELSEIAAALTAAAGTPNPTPEEVEAVAQRVRDLHTRIQGIIP